jgi:hypothetical protein
MDSYVCLGAFCLLEIEQQQIEKEQYDWQKFASSDPQASQKIFQPNQDELGRGLVLGNHIRVLWHVTCCGGSCSSVEAACINCA